VKDVVSRGLRARGLDPSKLLDVASNPEFLKEGDALSDFMAPPRVVIGVEKAEVAEKLHNLYRPFMRKQDRFVAMSVPSSELTKYAANSMLATRISFMNEMARLCDAVGANIDDIRRGIASDPRIGPDFLYAGLGYGGSCFPKDTKAIIELGKEYGSRLSVVEAVDRTNDAQREWFWEKISKHYGGDLKGKNIAVWGVAFKANTDDIRFAPSLYLMEKLIAAGASVSAFDPVAIDNARSSSGSVAAKVRWADNAYAALEGADALVICTEWREFRSPDFRRISSLMRARVVFDGRNLYSAAELGDNGFEYYGVGRGKNI
jgi:UDPglucose 6-dehydrogenase